MVVLLVLAALAALSWSVALAIPFSAFGPGMLTWLAASVYGPTTVRWEIGPWTLSPDRAVLFWFLLFVTARWLLGHSHPSQLRRDPAVWAGLAFGVLAALQAFLLPWNPTAPEDMPPPIRLAYVSVFPLILYVGVAAEPTGRGGDRRLALLIVVLWLFGLYLAVTALAEQLGVTSVIFPKHILRPRVLYPGRPVGPFLSTPLLGTTLVVCTAATVLVALRGRGVLRGAALCSLPLLLAAIVATETRSVWIGAVAVAGLLLVALAGRDLRYGLLLLGGAAAVLAGVFAGSSFVNPERVEGSQLVEYSFLQRLALMDGAVTLFVQKPVLGWGFGQFERVVRLHVGGGLLGFWATGAAEGLSSHSLPLRLLAETGAVGTGLWLSMWAVWCRRALALWRSGEADNRAAGLLFLAGTLAYWSETLFHDTSFLPAGNLMIALLAAVVTGRLAASRSDAIRAEVFASRATERFRVGVHQR